MHIPVVNLWVCDTTHTKGDANAAQIIVFCVPKRSLLMLLESCVLVLRLCPLEVQGLAGSAADVHQPAKSRKETQTASVTLLHFK